MKRDMDLLRDILLWMEEQKDFGFFITEVPEFDDRETTIGHIVLLENAGFLRQSQRSVYQITWEGHEFLDKVRDPEIWSKTKEGASKLNSWSVKLLGELATGYIKAKAAELGIPLA